MGRKFRQLTMLLHPFPAKVIHDNPGGGGQYVKHSTVEQRIIDALGTPPDTSMVALIRGAAPGKSGKPDLENVVCGVVLRMEAVIDGKPWFAEEVGDCELPSNWKHDGARAKDAFSDAYKRCAMRAGVALHLWSQDDFYLAEKLMKQDEAAAVPPVEGNPK